MKVVFMSDRIQELVNEIRGKATGWHQQLLAERATNQRLQKETEELKQQLSDKEEKILGLQQTLTGLEAKLEATKEKDVVVSEGTKVSDEQIDELVKEIEYCIAQLKK